MLHPVLVDFGMAEEYEMLRAVLAPLTVPYYLLPGNHDERQALRAAFPEHAYLQQNGERIEYVIDDHPLRIVALDTVIPRSSGGELAPASMGARRSQSVRQASTAAGTLGFRMLLCVPVRVIAGML